MSWLPSRAALWTALAALGAAFIAFLRRDARKDLTETLEKKDLTNAKSITDRVHDSRADPKRLQPFDDTGYRD